MVLLVVLLLLLVLLLLECVLLLARARPRVERLAHGAALVVLLSLPAALERDVHEDATRDADNREDG